MSQKQRFFYKKPEIITAIRWDNTKERIQRIYGLFGEQNVRIYHDMPNKVITIEKEGNKYVAYFGDYIVRDTSNNIFHVDAHDFHQDYREVYPESGKIELDDEEVVRMLSGYFNDLKDSLTDIAKKRVRGL